MRKQNLLKAAISLLILTLALALATQTVNALALKNVRTWYWTSHTEIESVARGDVDGDGKAEIVTGGWYFDGTREVAQLCVWSGGTLALENVQTWYWTGDTGLGSVAVGDVDGDGKTEIITGGSYYASAYGPEVAQLCVWNGATLALENVRTWYWTASTFIYSVAVGYVDGDHNIEIVTGGRYWDGTRWVAQLCVWDGAALTLKGVKTWYWGGGAIITSVAVGEVDGDGKVEIVTGGNYAGVGHTVAQLCVWSGGTLALENVQTWYWTGNTDIESVVVGDVDGDSNTEVVTGGYYNDGTREVAQLCVWSGGTLALENVQTWYWTGWTDIRSVAVGDVDGDSNTEVVTGGWYFDGTRAVAQLCVWG